jgi:aryl-alcohol dehydrogenase-like predicted oxidoreductase
MDYRMLGGSGCAVSSLCLGTMTFGAETDESGAHQQLDRFIEAGGTMVDTADVYGGGRSEEIIGRWFASRPADVTGPVVLATRAVCRWMTRRTAPGCPRATWPARWTPRCAG